MIDVMSDRPHLFLGSRMRRLAERMQSEAALVTEWAGVAVPAGLYSVLVTLDENGPEAIGELARLLGVTQPAMTKSIGRLLRAGLVSKAQGDDDKRQSVVALTEAGRAALDHGSRVIWPLVETAVRELTTGLSGSLVEQIAETERRLAIAPLSVRALEAAPADLRRATEDDIPLVVSLVNRAYRGTGSDAGWCSEAGVIEGDRTTEHLLRTELAERTDSTLLVWDLLGAVQGTVWLEPLGDDIWYLGSLAINPRMQGAQLGRRLLHAAEQWVRARGGVRIRLTVVNVREPLLAWYERRGYLPTGETEPFPYEDARLGVPTRPDLHFRVLAKQF